ncbi:antibiotic biosynthesis monooxygenase family protein [Oceanidesulfovibrio marinus]|uniref:Antibiotic biosynthesis monooxygenase n=1 Tax=Oceanidesulfovibrio marinus TaxID=370038 RepID=A0A6P1ZLU6_9BACT|nr:antibiotic biosynthesis monooxygenase family protein [Oceanidesulfovibrio marinus]QJT08073.1 antibiotic biosynthesis monooxygenase [Oceanidesulfovibrio marinus]TVM34889.1 antibiotic biosynthesis monooxygenase [Oceanidesulfovibrio marinus]
MDLSELTDDGKALLINPFEVEKGRDQEFLEFWNRAAALLKQKDGYVATYLQRAVAPGALFRYVNIAVWDSPEAFQNAVSDPEFQALVGLYRDVFPHFPGIYRTVDA